MIYVVFLRKNSVATFSVQLLIISQQFEDKDDKNLVALSVNILCAFLEPFLSFQKQNHWINITSEIEHNKWVPTLFCLAEHSDYSTKNKMLWTFEEPQERPQKWKKKISSNAFRSKMYCRWIFVLFIYLFFYLRESLNFYFWREKTWYWKTWMITVVRIGLLNCSYMLKMSNRF